MTADFLTLSDWLLAYEVTHVAMESTGEYWKPILNILESNFEVVQANAQHVKAVPGRKTDVNDAEWLVELFQYGLLEASFIPPVGQRDLRELTRHRGNFARASYAVQSCAESLGERQYQTGECRLRCLGRFGTRHAGSHHRRPS